MCQEIFRMALGMDLKSVEMQLALQCAPLITGVRISNLLMIESCNEPALRLVLKRSGISYFKLGQTEGKTAFLLFKRTKLEEFLQKNDSLEILKSSGYEEFSFGSILLKFKERYTTYITQQGMQFPHEMGLLLGYPAEDVEGFISNEGKNSLYCGYWKVYKNVAAKKRLFDEFEKSKECIIQLLADDIDMQLILEIYKDEPRNVAV